MNSIREIIRLMQDDFLEFKYLAPDLFLPLTPLTLHRCEVRPGNQLRLRVPVVYIHVVYIHDHIPMDGKP